VIACKPAFPAYLACLLPTDQVFDFDELEYHFQVANRTEDMPTEKKGILILYYNYYYTQLFYQFYKSANNILTYKASQI
jgi:hypothetical protein